MFIFDKYSSLKKAFDEEEITDVILKRYEHDTFVPNNLEDFLFKDNYDKYTETIKSLDTILFSNSTKMFNDINSLFILYHENIKPCYTKKIKINTKSYLKKTY